MATSFTALSETYTQTEAGNQIWKIARAFVDGSLTVSTRPVPVGTPEPWTLLDPSLYAYIGGGYLRTNPAIDVDTQIIFNYSVSVTGITSEVDLLQRVADLEARLAAQEKVTEIALRGLEERVGKQTFRVWIKALEKNFGLAIVPPEVSLFGIAGVNPYS